MWAFFVGDFMAIQTVDVTVPGGDTPRSANIKINNNFTNPAHAASRLVGTAIGNLMQVGEFGIGPYAPPLEDLSSDTPNGFTSGAGAAAVNYPPSIDLFTVMISIARGDERHILQFGRGTLGLATFGITSKALMYEAKVYTDKNVTKDSNGFLKGASPVIDLYDNKIGLNHDAEQQGGIMFEKLGVGDYLVKGSLGFAQEGWYIETPKDANGNVLVAVVYEQLANNDISIKTYAKKFDDETGDIVPNLLKPRDIPTGRFISLRLHELPKEPPVMTSQDTSADAPAQTNNP